MPTVLKMEHFSFFDFIVSKCVRLNIILECFMWKHTHEFLILIHRYLFSLHANNEAPQKQTNHTNKHTLYIYPSLSQYKSHEIWLDSEEL